MPERPEVGQPRLRRRLHGLDRHSATRVLLAGATSPWASSRCWAPPLQDVTAVAQRLYFVTATLPAATVTRPEADTLRERRFPTGNLDPLLFLVSLGKAGLFEAIAAPLSLLLETLEELKAMAANTNTLVHRIQSSWLFELLSPPPAPPGPAQPSAQRCSSRTPGEHRNHPGQGPPGSPRGRHRGAGPAGTAARPV